MARWTSLLALVALASQAGHAASEIVEAGEVTNVVVTSVAGWDVYNCGVEGCQPGLTRDGDDNTVPDSRWSCEPSLAETLDYTNTCQITFSFADYFDIDHIILYLHESDTQDIAIPFELGDYSGLTTPGLDLGVGQRINVNEAQSSGFELKFELNNGQYINLSEVEIFVDVEDPSAIVVPTADEIFVVNAKTVTNVVASAEYWELSTDAGCGVEGCLPSLATDGEDNTVTASRWSCTEAADLVYDDDKRCSLKLTLDDDFTISHIVLYYPNSMAEGLLFSVTGLWLDVPFEAKPGAALGTGQRFNLPKYEGDYIELVATNPTAEQVFEVSEVEIYVEVTDKSVPISAAEAWKDVTADTLTTVDTTSSENLTGFPATAARDGDDNTVAASRWACDGTGAEGYCELYFEFNDAYTISYLDLYMHQSANSTPVSVQICSCDGYYSTDCCSSYYGDVVGTYVTKPDTKVGEPDRVNLLYPEMQKFALGFDNLNEIGGTVGVSEVEIYLRTPDATPTPAPFQSDPPTPAPVYKPYGFDDDYLRNYLDDDYLQNYFDDDYLQNYFDDDGAGTLFSRGTLFCACVAVLVVVGSSSLW